MPWMKRGGLVLLLLLLAGSVGLWLVSRVEFPTVEIRQVSVQIPVNNLAQVQVQVAVSNTLNIPLSYFGADYKIALGKAVLVQGKLDLQGTVAAGAETIALLPLTVDLSRLEAARKAGARGVPATISGGLHVRLGAKKKTFPFVFKKRLAFGGEGVTSRVISAQIHLLEQGRARLKAVLEVTNPLEKPLRSRGTDYRLLLDQKVVARGSLKTKVEIPPGSKGPVELSVDLALPRQAAAAPRPQTMTVLATIRASIGGRSVRVPLRLHKELSNQPGAQACTPREVLVEARSDGSLGLLLSLGCRGDFATKVRSASVRYRALLDGAEVASGTATAKKTAGDKEGLTVQVPLTIRLDRLRKVRANAVGGPSSLKVTGLVSAVLQDSTLRLPFELTKMLTPGGMRCRLVELAVSSWGGKLRLAPRLRITGPGPLPAVQSMEATYVVSLAGRRIGSGTARLTGHGDKKQLSARGILVLDLARLRGLHRGPPGADLPLRVAGQVHLRANGKTVEVPYAFTRSVRPGGDGMSVSLRQVTVESPAKDRLILSAHLGVRSHLKQSLKNISASYSAHLQGHKLLQGTFRLPALGRGRAGQARVRLVMDPARLHALQSKAVGQRLVLLLRGVLTVSVPGQKEPLRVPFVVARSFRPVQGSLAVTVESVQVRQLSEQGLKATVGLALEGGAVKKIGKLHATYEVVVKKRVLVQGELKLKVASPTRWTASVPLVIDTRSLATLRQQGSETVPVMIRGRVTGHPRGRARVVVPFSVTRQVPLGRERPLAVTIKTVALNATSPGKLEVDLLLALRSRLKADLRDLDASYTVTAGGKLLLRGSFILQRLPANGTGEARIPLTISTAALEALKKNKPGGATTTPLQIRGKVAGKIARQGGKPSSFAVPFTIQKELALGGAGLAAEVLGVWIKEISTARVKLLVKLRLRGGRLEAARDVKARFEVKAQGQQLLSGELKLRSPGAGKSLVAEIPLTIRSARMRAIKKKNRGKKTALEIRGMVTASTAQGVVNIPFVVRKEATLMDRPLAVKLHRLDFSGMNFRNRTFRAILEVTNRAPFAIKNLNIEGKLILARGVEGRVLNRAVTIQPGQTTRLTLAIKAKRGGILRLMAQKFRGRRAKSRLRLKLSGKTADGTTITSQEDQGGTVAVGK